MLDKVLATFSMAALILFLGIVIKFVPEPDLFLVIVIPVGIAIYGVITSFREESNKDKEKPENG
jgi:cadmium resistance protein CadD (predicted permease)